MLWDDDWIQKGHTGLSVEIVEVDQLIGIGNLAYAECGCKQDED